MEEGQPGPVSPRENLIETAIKFLHNPKVQHTSLSQRKEFLRKKGLTEEEIQHAIDKSGAVENVAPSGGQISAQPPPPPLPPPVPWWGRMKDNVASAIVVGGVAYAVYVFFKKYISPWLYGPSEAEKRQEALQKMMVDKMEELQTSLTSSIQSLGETLERKADRVQDDRDSQFVNEIKAEIASVKSLLLSRNQFAPPPMQTPVLPSWQLKPQTSNTVPADNQTSTKDSSVSESSPSLAQREDPSVSPVPPETNTMADSQMVNGDSINHGETENLSQPDELAESDTSLQLNDQNAAASASVQKHVTFKESNGLVTDEQSQAALDTVTDFKQAVTVDGDASITPENLDKNLLQTNGETNVKTQGLNNEQ